MGSGAVRFAQTSILTIGLLMAVLLGSAYGELGGTGSLPITRYNTLGLNPPGIPTSDGSNHVFRLGNPISERASLIFLIQYSIKGESDLFRQPTSMPYLLLIRGTKVGVHLASFSAASMSSAKSIHSVSNAQSPTVINSGCLSPRSAANSFLCLPVSRRGCNSFCSLTRASRSPSASLRNCPASFSFAAARPLASSAFCSTLAMIWSDNRDVRTALNSSPAIPKIRIIRDSRASLCPAFSIFGKHFFGRDVNSAKYSPTQPKPTIPVKTYPANSQQANADLSDATSESVRIILFYHKREPGGPSKLRLGGEVIRTLRP